MKPAPKKMVSIGTQTISTGEIITPKIYNEEKDGVEW
jgi:hypothetical protein